MKSRKARLIVTLFAGITALAVIGPLASSATGATKYSFRFVAQPGDSVVDPATITSKDFVSGSDFVQVELIADGVRVTNVKQTVTFTRATADFGPDEAAAAGTLNVTPQPLVDGVATFGAGTLSIGTVNEPQFTSYALVPRNTKGALITGPASDAFDIFEAGCNTTSTCSAVIRGDTPQAGEDTYGLISAGTLGASELGASTLTGFVNACEAFGQTEIFPGSVFVHETTDTTTPPSPGPVSLTSHITRTDMKASANNGQAHVTWCVATQTEQPWLDNGGVHTPVAVDTNGTAPGGLLFVGTAPPCPQANPRDFAPCIVSQNGDGGGGNITTGWLPGGDPPRRT